MNKQEQVDVLVEYSKKIKEHSAWSAYQKNKAYFELFTLELELATSDDNLNFTTLFSRLAFAGARFQLDKSLLHFCHVFRKGHESGSIRTDNEDKFAVLGKYVCSALLEAFFKVKISVADRKLEGEVAAYFKFKNEKFIGFKSVVEAVLFDIDVENHILYFFDEEDPVLERKAHYDVHDRNELFNSNIDSLLKTFSLPIHINLIDVDIREDGVFLPHAFIIHPDHLVDVTAVSECFKDYGAEPFLYLLSKFKPAEASKSLMIGNLVNHMLDELISEPKIEFSSLLIQLFHSNPLGFALLDDIEVKELIDQLKLHFGHLQMVVNQEFKKFGIDREHIFLETSFFSRDYGIQGRLDLLHQKSGKINFDIIELKSGRTFKPNIYGINASHYIQTLLYDLMIKSAFRTKARSSNYILYSKEDNPLRFAPPVRAQQFEAMKLRNDIIAMEQKLKISNTDNTLFRYIKPENFTKLKGFNINDITNFHNLYFTLNDVEKSYFNNFSAFVAREHSLSKTGEHGINKSNGHAALWLESNEEKSDRFSLLSALQIIDNKSNQEDAFISFAREGNAQTLVNFRIGDLGVLYPMDNDGHKQILRNQIFKCTINELDQDRVVVRLRSKQFNQSLFQSFKFWCIEPDNLDSGFNAMYKSLFTWAASPFEFRKLILGMRKPKASLNLPKHTFTQGLTEHQSDTLQKMLEAQEYFLLWGPPGTGKTSVMLKHLVAHLHEETKENLLLLAYTNRAVDEICDAVMEINDSFQHKFLRLGSRLATDIKYVNNLLDQVVKKTTSRQEIIQLLAEKRIFISTVSSILNKTELFRLKSFDTVIIDEASQILEPMLVGLLSSFKKFILIGDHKQLPAVVVQPGFQSVISDDKLINIGILDTRMSLFERMYGQLVTNGWSSSYGILNQQGRMHSELMEFVNNNFYEDKLSILPNNEKQIRPTFFNSISDRFQDYRYRKIFVDVVDEEDALNWKTNIAEAETCLKIVRNLLSLYIENGMIFNHQSIGIITPYRAQIALIRQHLSSLPNDVISKITVDTVERYQGGARDIIIISFCVNKLSQLDSLVSLSHEGVDRKLNVALTRAKEQLILVGNARLLESNDVYKSLIDSCHQVDKLG